MQTLISTQNLITEFHCFFCSIIADPEPDPEGSETFGSGTEIKVSDPDSDPASNPDPKLNPKKIWIKEPYFQAETRWFHMIKHISHLQVVATIAVL